MLHYIINTHSYHPPQIMSIYSVPSFKPISQSNNNVLRILSVPTAKMSKCFLDRPPHMRPVKIAFTADSARLNFAECQGEIHLGHRIAHWDCPHQTLRDRNVKDSPVKVPEVTATTRPRPRPRRCRTPKRRRTTARLQRVRRTRPLSGRRGACMTGSTPRTTCSTPSSTTTRRWRRCTRCESELCDDDAFFVVVSKY